MRVRWCTIWGLEVLRLEVAFDARVKQQLGHWTCCLVRKDRAITRFGGDHQVNLVGLAAGLEIHKSNE